MTERSGLMPVRWLTLAAVASVGLWPVLPHLSAVAPLAALGDALMPWFAFHCHLEPLRTPWLAGLPLAVCARCSGVYFGFGLGALLRRPELSPRALRYAVLAAALIMLADVTLERFGWHPPWAVLRLLTGALLSYPIGVGLGALIVRAPVSLRRQSP